MPNFILTANQLQEIVSHVSMAPFSYHLLAVDEPLWGGVWHFDVLAPGSRLPAVELALLRGIRLDGYWPEGTSSDQFLADLRAVIVHPHPGLWALTVAGEPCLVFAAKTDPALVTVGWYCITTGQLHAGYRTPVLAFSMPEAIGLQSPLFSSETPHEISSPPEWLSEVIQQKADMFPQDLAERLDVAILRWRARTR
jgi:hypothetical protein